MNQTERVKKEITRLMDSGIADKKMIYDMVVSKLAVPRPTVRRAARQLRLELVNKVEVIQES